MMRTITVYLLLLMSSFCDQVCSDESSPEDDNGDESDSTLSTPVAFTLTTTPAYGGGHRSNSGDSTYPPTSHTESKANRCAHYDDIPSSSSGLIEPFIKPPNSEINKKVQDDSNVFYSNFSIECSSYCFTLWVADPRNKSRVTVSKQGCWQIPEGKECQPSSCISDLPPRQNNTHFCCCSGYMCNVRFMDVYNPPKHTTTTAQAAHVAFDLLPDHSYKKKTIIVALVSVVSVSLVIVFLYLAYRLCLTTKPSSPQSSSVARVETPEPLLPVFNVDDLKIEDIIVRGRYSEVRRGRLGDKEVAVKIYQPHHRQYYYNERNAFTQPFMDHENLVKFYGAKEQEDPETSLLQYIVVTEYIPLGTLTSYLKNNTIDWYTLCHMCQGVARGLAHLHTDIQKGDLFKPAIAHRDLNTRNILVNPDLTCVIVDLGFSVGMIGSRIIKNGVAENAEQATLADVGTLRYMAPEVFDGAVNLRDCEASLKQIDVYSLGLVIWEIASRCVDLYQGAPVPEYQLPFHAEAGLHPSFEEMQVLVVKYKTRPRFPEVWKDANPAVRSLKETIEDCWDTDAEARLTSLCVQERIADMASLWLHGAKHRGVPPTLNATINLPENGSNGVIHNSSAVVSNGVTYIPSYVDRNNEANADTGTLREREETNSPVISDCAMYRGDVQTADPCDGGVSITAPLVSNIGRLCSSSSFVSDEGRVKSWVQDQSMSGSTVDTMLPPTPLEDNTAAFDAQALDHPHVKANNVIIARHKAVIVHPNQGRNPTVERNTHKRSDEELTVSGNVLLAPGDQVSGGSDDRNNRRGSLGAQSAPSNRNVDGGSFEGLETIESSLLVQNDSLNQNHVRPRNTPIPYFQNHVHSESAGAAVASHLARPKLANINGNRSSYLRLQGDDAGPQQNASPGQVSVKMEAKSLKHKLSKLIRPKDLGSKFTHFVFGGIHKRNCNAHVTSGSVDVETATGRCENANRVSGQYINSGLDASPVNRSLASISTSTPGMVSMEVQLVNGSFVTQACSDTNLQNTQNHQSGSTFMGPQGRLSATNVMRLGVLANPNIEELPSPSLFPKSVCNSSVIDPSCQSDLAQGHAVPLQNLVVVKPMKDYGSMHPVILNQAYGLESQEDTSSSGCLKTSELVSIVGNHDTGITLDLQSNEDESSSSDLPLTSVNLSNGHMSTSTGGISESGSWKLNGLVSFASPEPSLVFSCGPGIFSTVIQSPQNKTISPLNTLPSFSAIPGHTPDAVVKKFPEEMSQGVCSNQTLINGLLNYHTDTKGGNSVMHGIHVDTNSRPKEQSHSSNTWTKKLAQLPAFKSHPEKSAASAFKQSHTKGGNITDTVLPSFQNVLHKSNQGLSQSRSVADMERHQCHMAAIDGETDGQTDNSRRSKDNQIWQEADVNDSLSLSRKTRPQSLSLKGHNYNRNKRGRSVSSSSLSSVSLCQSTKTHTNPGVETNDENGPLTFVVPNVTLDKSSPLVHKSNSASWKPALLPVTSVAMPVAPSISVCTMSSGDSVGHVTKSSVTNSETVRDAVNAQGKSNLVHAQSTDRTCSTSHTTSTITASNSTITASNSTITASNSTIGKKHFILKQQSDSSEKIRRRIKTPVSFKKGRLSLYDDRLMTQSLGHVSLSNMGGAGMPRGGGDSNNNSGAGSSAEISKADYYKLIKSESDLVV